MLVSIPMRPRQDLAQLGHVQLQQLPRRGRWQLAPERVGELVQGADLPVSNVERGEQPSLHRGQGDRPSVGEDLDRPKHAKLVHAAILLVRARSTASLPLGASVRPMSYAVVQDVPASWEHYASYALALEGDVPAGLVVHAAGPTDEGFRMIDVWESRAAWHRFRTERLEPVSRTLPRQPVSRELELEHVVVGASDGSAQAIASGNTDGWRSR